MNDEAFFDLAVFLRDQFLEIGLGDIADFGHYADVEGQDRAPQDGRLLIWGMLTAFDRYLASNASETVKASLALIGESIDDGERPREAVVHAGQEELDVSVRGDAAQPISALEAASGARKELIRLRELLLEGYEPPVPEGETR